MAQHTIPSTFIQGGMGNMNILYNLVLKISAKHLALKKTSAILGGNVAVLHPSNHRITLWRWKLEQLSQAESFLGWILGYVTQFLIICLHIMEWKKCAFHGFKIHRQHIAKWLSYQKYWCLKQTSSTFHPTLSSIQNLHRRYSPTDTAPDNSGDMNHDATGKKKQINKIKKLSKINWQLVQLSW